MEYFKNSFQTWRFVEKQKKMRDSIRNTVGGIEGDRMTQQENAVPLMLQLMNVGINLLDDNSGGQVKEDSEANKGKSS